MENTTNKKKSWLPILLGAVGLIVILVVGIVLWKTETFVPSPYQKWLSAAKSCIEDQLGVQMIYTKEISPEVTGFTSSGPILSTYFLMQALAKSEKGFPKRMTDKILPEFWANFQFDCDFRLKGFGANSLDKMRLTRWAKEFLAKGQPFLVLDFYDEGTQRFEIGPIEAFFKKRGMRR